MLLKGKYIGNVIHFKFDRASTGTEQIELEFFVPAENENIRAFLYFSDKAWQRSVETLKVCGWDGVDFGTLDGLGTNEVELVVDEEEYQGKVRYKVKWINPIGGGSSSGMEEDEARSFAAKMNARIKSLGKSAPSGKAPASKPAAKQASQKTKQAPGNQNGDDDGIPF